MVTAPLAITIRSNRSLRPLGPSNPAGLPAPVRSVGGLDPMGILDNYETADQAFRTKAVLTQDNETLLSHLHGLANQNNTNSGTQHRDIIRGLTINSILMQRHIDALNKQNAKTEKWVIALAVAALISSVVQIFSPVLFPAPPTEIKQQPPVVQLSCPTPVAPQASCPTTKKKH